MASPPVSTGLSRDGLHHLLWLRRGGRNEIRVHQRELAQELYVSRFALLRALARMVDEGRLIPIPGPTRRPPMFEVVDPATWAAKGA